MASMNELLRRPKGRMKESHSSGDEGSEPFARRKRTNAAGGGEHAVGGDTIHGKTMEMSRGCGINEAMKLSGDRHRSR